jgi:hypothetical protein
MKYLVRPSDYHIFEIDNSNQCYRSYTTQVTYTDGTRPNAQVSFTFENLTMNYGFIPINEGELEKYKELHEAHMNYIMWSRRSDGHGGTKGGTLEEYLELLKK